MLQIDISTILIFSILCFKRLNLPWTFLGRTAIIYTDTFILLSGALVAYSLVKELDRQKGRINFKSKYISRFLRYESIVINIQYIKRKNILNYFVSFLSILFLLFLQNSTQLCSCCFILHIYHAIDGFRTSVEPCSKTLFRHV